ncbi:MAG TPA: zinc-binding dehydrogenase [Chloroflexota bacterium]|nr:zinc-binding dehydrogenase [Chloroflexota bacterium]
MKAARVVFPAAKKIVIEEYETGSPGPGQVLLKTEKTLISTGTELTGLSGEFPEQSNWAKYVQYPWVPGYSYVGTVLEVGHGVQGLQPGERVVGAAPHASAVVVEAGAIMPLPAAVGAEEGTFARLAATVLNGVRRAKIEVGECVVIVGAGLLGQMAAQFGRLSGAFPLVMVDLAEGRLALAKTLGVHETLRVSVDKARPEILRLSKNRGIEAARLQRDGGADCVFEVTGSAAVVAGAVGLARREGRVILLGSSRGASTIDFHDDTHGRGIFLIGAHASTTPRVETPQTPWTRHRNEELILELTQAGLLNVRDLITHRYAGTRAADAYAMLLEDRTRALGVILDWTNVT